MATIMVHIFKYNIAVIDLANNIINRTSKRHTYNTFLHACAQSPNTHLDASVSYLNVHRPNWNNRKSMECQEMKIRDEMLNAKHNTPRVQVNAGSNDLQRREKVKYNADVQTFLSLAYRSSGVSIPLVSALTLGPSLIPLEYYKKHSDQDLRCTRAFEKRGLKCALIVT